MKVMVVEATNLEEQGRHEDCTRCTLKGKRKKGYLNQALK